MNLEFVIGRFKQWGLTMGRPVPKHLVVAYANAFADERRLKEVSKIRLYAFLLYPLDNVV